MGVGDGVSGGDAASALKSSRSSSPVRTGKRGLDWLTISVWTRSPRIKRIALPRDSVIEYVSGMLGKAVAFEKRTRTGVEGLLKWGAEESFAASGVGVKVPLRRIPLA